MIKTYSGSQKAFGACLVFLLLLFSGCEKRTGSSDNKITTPQTVAKLDACSLITREELRAIQNSTVTETKSSANANGGFRVSQCFYTTQEFSKSVSLTVTQRDPEHPTDRTPKDYWKQVFGSPTKKEGREQERSSEEEERAAPPKKIDGVGDEAYWTGIRFGGALYVLKSDVFIRISVGGGDTEEIKINRSKALALDALKRL